MYNLNYNQLYYFYVVASLGSIKEACKRLNLTQPSISGGIKNLEDSLGVKLFNREYRKLTLNNHGKKIYKKAEEIFEIGEELLNDITKVEDSNENYSFSVAAQPSIPRIFLDRYLNELLKNFKFNVDVHIATADELTRLVTTGEVDLALSENPMDDGEGVKISQKINAASLYVVGSKKYEGLKNNFPYSISKIPIMAFNNKSCTQKEIEYYFQRFNIRLNKIGSSNDCCVRKLMALTRDCLTILPKDVTLDDFSQHSLCWIGEIPGMSFNTWATLSKTSKYKRLILQKLFKNNMSIEHPVDSNGQYELLLD